MRLRLTLLACALLCQTVGCATLSDSPARRQADRDALAAYASATAPRLLPDRPFSQALLGLVGQSVPVEALVATLPGDTWDDTDSDLSSRMARRDREQRVTGQTVHVSYPERIGDSRDLNRTAWIEFEYEPDYAHLWVRRVAVAVTPEDVRPAGQGGVPGLEAPLSRSGRLADVFVDPEDRLFADVPALDGVLEIAPVAQNYNAARHILTVTTLPQFAERRDEARAAWQAERGMDRTGEAVLAMLCSTEAPAVAGLDRIELTEPGAVDAGVGVVLFPGALYVGAHRNGIPHGIGRLILPSAPGCDEDAQAPADGTAFGVLSGRFVEGQADGEHDHAGGVTRSPTGYDLSREYGTLRYDRGRLESAEGYSVWPVGGALYRAQEPDESRWIRYTGRTRDGLLDDPAAGLEIKWGADMEPVEYAGVTFSEGRLDSGSIDRLQADFQARRGEMEAVVAREREEEERRERRERAEVARRSADDLRARADAAWESLRPGTPEWIRGQPSYRRVTQSAVFRADGLTIRAISVHNPGSASCRIFVSGDNRIAGVTVESSNTAEYVVPAGRTVDLGLLGPDSDMALTTVTLSHGCGTALEAASR